MNRSPEYAVRINAHEIAVHFVDGFLSNYCVSQSQECRLGSRAPVDECAPRSMARTL